MKSFVTPLMLAAAIAVAGSPFAQQSPQGSRSADGKSVDGAPHKTRATVEKVDPAAGTVTLSHEPVKSLNWPAMTMGFKVRDKVLFDKLAKGKKVEVEFVQSGKDYVITKAN